MDNRALFMPAFDLFIVTISAAAPILIYFIIKVWRVALV